MTNRTFSYTRNLLTTSWMIHPGVAASLYPMLAGALSGAVFEVQPLDKAYTVPAEGDGSAPQSSYKVFVDKISGTMFKHDSCCDKGTRTIASELLEADADPEVAAHVLIIESGGGASNSVPELEDAFARLTKPVVAWVDGMACSAAQWAAALCAWTVASRDDDEVGCIGTMAEFHSFRRSGSVDSDGMDVVRVYADGSDRKNEWAESALEGNVKIVKEQLLNPHCERFKEAMRRLRPAVTDEHLRGATYRAGDVVGILVDSIGPFQSAVDKAVELAKEKGIIAESQSNDDMEEFENITSVAGLEDLQVQADGMVTLNRDQLAALDSALQEAAGAEELQTRVSALEAENTTLRGEITARETRIRELEQAIAEGDQGASDALHGDGGQQHGDGAGHGAGDPVSAARAYMEEYRKRNTL